MFPEERRGEREQFSAAGRKGGRGRGLGSGVSGPSKSCGHFRLILEQMDPWEALIWEW